MIVIMKSGQWELIESPQDPAEAWALADKLTAKTGVYHWPGRV
jgi:hypothetical protein